MALFKRKDGGAQTQANQPWAEDPAPIDPTYGDPQTQAYLAAVAAGDYQTVSRILHGATPAGREAAIAASPDDAGVAVQTAQRWLSEWPDDPMGLLFAGDAMTVWAWDARGNGRATTVDQDAWAVYFDRLKEADRFLREAARAMPADPLPWALMITTGLGLQIPLEEQSARFDEAHRRDPWNYTATMCMLQSLCPKWWGTDDQMMTFARFAASETPEGSATVAALPMAYIERAVEIRGEQGINPAFAKVMTPSAVREIEAAAERSIFHPAFVPDTRGLAAANVFLDAFFAGKQWVSADRTIRLLQRRYGRTPHQYFGEPSLLVRKMELVVAERMAGIGPTAVIQPLR